MKGGAQPQGYTIVETMIFLAVSGMLFVTAALFMNGRQRQTQFDQAVRDLDSRFTDIANNISTGYYQRSGGFTCTSNNSTAPTIGPGSSNIGTNLGCIYIGNVIQMRPNGSNEQFRVVPIAGNRLTNAGFTLRETTSVAEAKPTPIKGGSFDASESITLPGGLTFANMSYNDGAASHEAKAVGFFTTFNSTANNGGLQSGSLVVDLYALNPPGNNEGDLDSYIITNTSWHALANPVGGIRMCFNSGSTNQHVAYTLGGSGKRYGSTYQIAGGSC